MNGFFSPVVKIALLIMVLVEAAFGLLVLTDLMSVEMAKGLAWKTLVAMLIVVCASVIVGLMTRDASSSENSNKN